MLDGTVPDERACSLGVRAMAEVIQDKGTLAGCIQHDVRPIHAAPEVDLRAHRVWGRTGGAWRDCCGRRRVVAISALRRVSRMGSDEWDGGG